MNLTDVRSYMACMPYKNYNAWEIEVAAIIVECMSRGVFQGYFTREDLRNYYHFLQNHFQSDNRLEERISTALNDLTDHGLLIKLTASRYILAKGELLDYILELRIIGYPAARR